MSWPTKKLSDLLETCDAGVWGKPAMSGKGLLVLRSTNMTNNGHLDFSDVAERKIEGDTKKVKLSDGDILVEKSGGGPDQPVGRVAHFTAPNDRAYSFANFIQRLRVKPKLIDSRFLFYRLLFLHKIGFTKKLQSQTTGIRNLKLSLYLKTEIPVPALNIQKQIVERLDKIAEAQKLNDELIQKTDELYRSLLHNELNAKFKNQNSKSQLKIKKLEEVAEVTSSKRIYQSEYVQGGIPFYRTKEIVELSQNKPISLELFISEKRFNEIRKKFGVPRKEDILISAVGTIGISWIIPDDREFYFKDGNLLWIRNIKDANPLYLKIVLDNFAKNIARMGAGGAYNALTNIKLKRVKIPLPPLETQKQIVEKLSAVQGYKVRLLEQKSRLKELFESVLAKSMSNK